jgi:hypothetical protein
MESELLKKLTSDSNVANEVIKRLKSKIDLLKTLQGDDEVIKNLQDENRKLKEQVEVLKQELISLDGPQPALAALSQPVEQPKPQKLEQQQPQPKPQQQAKEPKKPKQAKGKKL